MKKLLLIAALLFASYGAFADQFDDFVIMLRQAGKQQGWVIRSNRARRIAIIEAKLPCASDGMTQEQFNEFKPMFVEMFKKSLKAENIPTFKSLNIAIQFNIITTDGKIFKLVIAPRDL